MPAIENRWTWGNIASLITLILTIIGVGIAIGGFNARLEAVERTATQAVSDSRTLIRVEADIAYIREAIDDLRSVRQAGGEIACPPERPVFVASYCRQTPEMALR